MGIRVRVCFRCKMYAMIYALNNICFDKLKRFNSEHKGHSLQTVQLSELDKSYVIWISKEPPICIIKKEFW